MTSQNEFPFYLELLSSKNASPASEDGTSLLPLNEQDFEGVDGLLPSMSPMRFWEDDASMREEPREAVYKNASELDEERQAQDRTHFYAEAEGFLCSEETVIPSKNHDDFPLSDLSGCIFSPSKDTPCPFLETDGDHHDPYHDRRSACSPSESDFSAFSENLSTVGHGEVSSHCEDDYAESEDKDYSQSQIEECLEELKNDLNTQVDEIIQRGPGLNRSEIAEKIPGEHPGTFKWRCRDCFKEYDHRTSVFKHHDADHKKIRHHCADCDSHYSSSQGLKKHCNKTGHRPANKPTKIKKFIKKDGNKRHSRKRE